MAARSPLSTTPGCWYADLIMTHRERVLRAVNLKEPDSLPLDLGSHINSSIHRTAYARLKDRMKIESKTAPPIISRMMQDVAVEEPVLEALDIDTRGVFQGAPVDNGVIDEEAGRWTDEWGVSWTMPKGGHYYEPTRAPLSGEITVGDISRYPWPDPDDPGITVGLLEQVEKLRKTGDYAIVLNLPSMFVHQSQYMRGFADWYLDLAAEPALVDALFDAVLEVRMGIASRILQEVGREVDIIMTADDMGTQKALQFSPEHYRRFFKPRNAKFFEMIRAVTDAPILLHSCGSVYEIIGDLIDIGLQILNPVQTYAAQMEPALLKREFGKHLAFWGAVDIQHVLPFGTVEEVEDEVKRLFETLGKGGGWVVCPCHNIQPEVPPDNIIAMYRAGRELCRY